jgi:anti-sigma-K factor RskA
VDTSMNHGEFEELAAGYALGALEPDDEAIFQRHLDGCPTCAANVRELEGVAAQLAYAVPPVQPPETVWAGIRHEIVKDARPDAAPASGRVVRNGARRRRSRLLTRLAAAAAVVLLAALSVWNLNLRDQNQAYRDRVAALEQATRLVNEPNATRVVLDDAPSPPGAVATVIASTRQDRGVLIVEGLPPLQRRRVYELWVVPGGNIADAQKALVFVPLRRQGVQTLEFTAPIQPGTVFALTEEPGPAGSVKPTTDPLMIGVPATA